MAGEYTAAMALKLIDGVSPKFVTMSSAVNKWSNVQARAMNRANRDLKQIANTAKGFVFGQAFMSGVNMVRSGISGLVGEWLEFDKAAHFAAARFQEVQNDASLFDSALLQVKNTANAVGRQTKFTATQVAEGMNQMAMGGESLKNTSVETMLAIAKFAQVAGTDIPDAAGILTSGLAAWGWEMDRIGELSDRMIKSVTGSKLSIEDLAESTKKSGGLFRATGQDIQTYHATVMALSQLRLPGEEIGVRTRSIMTTFFKEKSVKNLWDRFRISARDADGNFRDFFDVIKDINSEVKGMGTFDMPAFLKEGGITQQRDITSFLQLLEMSEGKLDFFRKIANRWNNASDRQWKLINGNIQDRIDILKSAITSKFFTGMETARSPMAQFITDMVNAVDNFDMTPINDFIKMNLPIYIRNIKLAMSKWVPAIKSASKDIATMLKFMLPLVPVFIKLVPWIIKYKMAMMAFAIAQGAVIKVLNFGLLMQPMVRFFRVFFLMMSKHGMVKAFAWSFKFLGAAIRAAFLNNPIGWIVVGIVALGTALYVVNKNWDEWGATITRVWGVIRPFLMFIFPPLFLLIDTLISIRNNWDYVAQAFKDGGIIGALKAIGGIMLNSILTPLTLIVEAAYAVGALPEKMYQSYKGFQDALLGQDYDYSVMHKGSAGDPKDLLYGFEDARPATQDEVEYNQKIKNEIAMTMTLAGNTDVVEDVAISDASRVPINLVTMGANL
jgi:TP901 family phage tail tape measure protein